MGGGHCPDKCYTTKEKCLANRNCGKWTYPQSAKYECGDCINAYCKSCLDNLITIKELFGSDYDTKYVVTQPFTVDTTNFKAGDILQRLSPAAYDNYCIPIGFCSSCNLESSKKEHEATHCSTDAWKARWKKTERYYDPVYLFRKATASVSDQSLFSIVVGGKKVSITENYYTFGYFGTDGGRKTAFHVLDEVKTMEDHLDSHYCKNARRGYKVKNAFWVKPTHGKAIHYKKDTIIVSYLGAVDGYCLFDTEQEYSDEDAVRQVLWGDSEFQILNDYLSENEHLEKKRFEELSDIKVRGPAGAKSIPRPSLYGGIKRRSPFSSRRRSPYRPRRSSPRRLIDYLMDEINQANNGL